MTLPPSLERFEADLEVAVTRDLARTSRRRRGRRVRAVFATSAAAVLALAVVAVAPERGGESAVARAAAVLAADRDGILHMETVERATGPGGAIAPVRLERWQAGADWRTIQTQDGVRRESSMVGGVFQFYDAERETIYEMAPANPKPGLPEKARKEGSRDGDLRSKLEVMLDSGKFHEAGRTTVRGREAIRIESEDGRSVFVADAESYVPLEWRTAEASGSVRFLTYETLPDSAANRGLLRLSDVYPGVRVARGAEAEAASVDRW